MLASGLRVVSQETHAYMSAIGCVVEAGSAYEVARLQTRGAAQLSETLAWSGTLRRSRSQVLRDVDEMGGYVHANAQREQTLYCIDVLRDAIEPAVRLLSESLLMPAVSDEHVRQAHQLVDLASFERNFDARCKEAVHAAAYGPKSPLGSLVAEKGTASALAAYRAAFVRPDRIVLAASGVRHDDLVRLAEEHLEPFLPPASLDDLDYDSRYVGASNLVSVDDKEEPFVRVVLAAEACDGWSDEKQLVALSVLQTLLGGGDSFSAGGPGKGMYSRLYREVLNVHPSCEAAEAYVSVHRKTGLLGIAGAAKPDTVARLAVVFAKQLRRLAVEPVSPEELARAKNMLKCNVLTQLESRLCLFEDLARQFATLGRRQPLSEMSSAVDAVTADDILKLGARMISKPPAFAAVGNDLSKLPPHPYLTAIMQG